MAYSTSNPPAIETQAINGRRRWSYVSADAIATVDGAGYFSNGFDLGMKLGDVVEVTVSSSGATAILYVNNTPTASLAPDTTDGTTISATDTD